MRCVPSEMYAYETHTGETHAHEVRTREMHAHEMHAHKMDAHGEHVREMHAREVHAYGGFCEDLARQTTVTHLSQLQLGVSGFSRRCGVLKVSI